LFGAWDHLGELVLRDLSARVRGFGARVGRASWVCGLGARVWCAGWSGGHGFHGAERMPAIRDVWLRIQPRVGWLMLEPCGLMRLRGGPPPVVEWAMGG
jgi:hypothetical protein